MKKPMFTVSPGAEGYVAKRTVRTINQPGAGYYPKFGGALNPRFDRRVSPKGFSLGADEIAVIGSRDTEVLNEAYRAKIPGTPEYERAQAYRRMYGGTATVQRAGTTASVTPATPDGAVGYLDQPYTRRTGASGEGAPSPVSLPEAVSRELLETPAGQVQEQAVRRFVVGAGEGAVLGAVAGLLLGNAKRGAIGGAIVGVLAPGLVDSIVNAILPNVRY